MQRAIHVVDRAFIDGRFWDQQFKLYRSTVITRMKSVLKYTCIIPVKQLCSKSSDFGNKVIFIPRFTGFHDCIEDRQQLMHIVPFTGIHATNATFLGLPLLSRRP